MREDTVTVIVGRGDERRGGCLTPFTCDPSMHVRNTRNCTRLGGVDIGVKDGLIPDGQEDYSPLEFPVPRLSLKEDINIHYIPS